MTRAIAGGVVVVRFTGAPSGSVRRNVAINDDEIGTVASGKLSPAEARVLLKLALVNATDTERFRGTSTATGRRP